MKTIVLLASTLFLGLTSMCAQVWCAPGAVWQYYIQGPFPASGPFGVHELSYTKTVSIDGNIYDELNSVAQGSFYTFPWTKPGVTIHIREQNGLVYYRTDDSEDTLANLNAQPGDSWYAEWATDTMPTKKTVVATGQVMVGNVNRKAVFFDTSGAYPLGFIDGVGFNFGFFTPYHWYDANAMDIAPMNGNFKCYTESQAIKYTVDPAWACKMLGVGLAERTKDVVAVKPNPATDHFEIDMVLEGNITVYNIAGTPVKSETFSAGTMTVNCEELSRGIYIIEIRSGSNITRGKLILQ